MLKLSYRTVVILLALGLAGSVAFGRRHHNHASDTSSSAGSFDYYLLNLSWAPEFCATHSASRASSECDPSRHYGFIVHGLWPQSNSGSYPQDCETASPVSQQIVAHILPIMPARGLIQHEWATHGTCTGLSPQDYFAQVEKAYSAVQVPPEYRRVSQPVNASPAEMEQKFADLNHAPRGAFRISCSGGEFVAVEACLTKDLQYRPCGSGVRECPVSQVTVRATP